MSAAATDTHVVKVKETDASSSSPKHPTFVFVCGQERAYMRDWVTPARLIGSNQRKICLLAMGMGWLNSEGRVRSLQPASNPDAAPPGDGIKACHEAWVQNRVA